jgi:hypothetical protein|tara:strand:- start:1670 stop:1936 length:267 start_codon:yes stop_codon:yes gene_type:complete
MLQSVFDKKAEQMGDFHVYYQKRDSSVITFAVCTADLDIPYIQERLRGMKPGKGEVLLWNWRYNSPLRVPYEKIKKLTPLSAVLKNHR